MECRAWACTAVDKVVRAHEMCVCGTDGCQMACMCVGHVSRWMGCWKGVQQAKEGVALLVLNNTRIP